MDLSTQYAGLDLKNPIIVSSSKLTGSIRNVKKCAEIGAGAVILKSIFEEQILDAIKEQIRENDMYFWFPEAEEHVKSISTDQGVSKYLDLIREAKDAVDIPVVASVNCVGGERWLDFARKIEDAGADAIELNVAVVPYDESPDSNTIENLYVKIVRDVVNTVGIPVTLKMGFYFSNIVRMAISVQNAGAKGLVVFNRFYRPDIDIDSFEIVNHHFLSSREECSHSLRWVCLLSDKLDIEISASTGIHEPEDAIKHILAGAPAVQICSTLYKNGIEQISKIRDGIERWMLRKGFERLDDFRGKVGRDTLQKSAFERIQYMERTLS